ncbi:RluA family pseudouridine synthase [Effusibacillus lacus]|uniref:Pseudouridine synthase n=1 Tax=Effusibacillus lacus TaxID=1348429 RepID=A0A292YN52_9BACL|nr:RluA family pseudouridine synthase [Effusibacillus lacus]TCS71395.1 tRNA pseudouridine32 synthase/23S rRNA pseudouridine746 synthase/23S rRNA pseudouridine1911/1915/1917 synthase [Effusibacillus lacus]GAX89925.1 RNA pseudouridine synthase [Effusibacillus lacus]
MKKNRGWLEFTIPKELDGAFLQDILTGPMRISRRMIQKLTRSKGILYNGKPTFLKRQVKSGHVVQVATEVTTRQSLQPEQIPFPVLFEDDTILVVDKPSGINVHPIHPGQSGTLANGIAWHWQQQGLQLPVRPIHRLDRDTSGILIVGKSAYSHQHLDRQLREGQLDRVYVALVEGEPEEDTGTLKYPIGKNPRTPSKRKVREDGDPAVTHYKVLERLGPISLLELSLETGRTHQIRVHLAHFGYPVLGDRQYGKASPLIKRQALHALRLSFTHPGTGESMELEAPLPEDMQSAMERVRNL